jgi:hypothetical protein
MVFPSKRVVFALFFDILLEGEGGKLRDEANPGQSGHIRVNPT